MTWHSLHATWAVTPLSGSVLAMLLMARQLTRKTMGLLQGCPQLKRSFLVGLSCHG